MNTKPEMVLLLSPQGSHHSQFKLSERNLCVWCCWAAIYFNHIRKQMLIKQGSKEYVLVKEYIL